MLAVILSSLIGQETICHYNQWHWMFQGYCEIWEWISALCHWRITIHEYHWSSSSLKSCPRALLCDLQLCLPQLIDVVVAVWLPFCRKCLRVANLQGSGWKYCISVPLFMVGWIFAHKAEGEKFIWNQDMVVSFRRRTFLFIKWNVNQIDKPVVKMPFGEWTS